MTATATERGDLAQRLLPVAAGLACIVQGDGGQQDIAHILDPLTDAERTTLIVVLAGLVDPDRSIADALAFLAWDETRTPVPPTRDKRPLRDIAKVRTPSPGIDALLREERKRTARTLYHDRDMPQSIIAERLGVTERTIVRWIGTGNPPGAGLQEVAS
jgi:hypothetical protein